MWANLPDIDNYLLLAEIINQYNLNFQNQLQ